MVRIAAMLIALALPLGAEWLAFEISFQGSGCESCIESLPKRIQRMRGVARAEVDAERSLLRVTLEAGNRVRLELVRDQIEQDGTKATGARLEGVGAIEKSGDRAVFRLSGLPLTYALEGDAGSHAGSEVRLTATAAGLRPEPVLRIVRIDAAKRP